MCIQLSGRKPGSNALVLAASIAALLGAAAPAFAAAMPEANKETIERRVGMEERLIIKFKESKDPERRYKERDDGQRAVTDAAARRGVAFTELTPEALAALSQFCLSHPAHYYEL